MALISKVGRKQWKVRGLLLSITTLLWLGVIIHLFPIYWSFITSIKEPWEVFAYPPTLWPHKLNLASYIALFKFGTGTLGFSSEEIHYPLTLYLKNTFVIVAGTMVVQIPICIMVAYALSKLHRSVWNRFLFLYLIAPMLVPMTTNIIPMFLLIRHFPFATRHIPKIPFINIPFPYVNLSNTFLAIILPSAYSAFFTLLLKGYFDAIPDELINAARLDGASELGIMWRIILPLSKPVLAVVTYFSFTSIYNSFLWPLIILREEKWPLSVYVMKLGQAISWASVPPGAAENKTLNEGVIRSIQRGLGPNTVMAISIIQSIPVFIMFIIFREQLMKGIKLRGFK